jgi:hypothetical protein
MVPSGAPDAVKASYWDALTNPVGSGAVKQGTGNIGQAMLGPAGILTTPVGQQFGGQAIKAMVQPIAHPIASLEGAYNMVRHPLDTGAAIANQVKSDYQQGGLPLVAENISGQIAGGVEGGRALGAGSSAAVKAAAPVISNVADRTAVGLYRNALKPPPGSMSAAESTAKVRTGLDYSIPVSAGGVEKLGNLIDDYNTKIADELQKYPNRTVDPNAIASRADQAKANFAQQVNPNSDVSAIEASKQEYLAKHGAVPSKPGAYDQQSMTSGPSTPAKQATPYPAVEAQAEKQATYRVLRGKYGEQGSAAVEAQKSLARGAKEEIATQFPEINNLNAGESRLLDLGPVLERAVNRISNNHTIGIGGSIAAGGIKAATGSTGVAAAVGLMKSIFDIPAIKSQVAIALSKGAKIPYSQALARVSAYQAQLGSAGGAVQGYSSGDNSNQPAQ